MAKQNDFLHEGVTRVKFDESKFIFVTVGQWLKEKRKYDRAEGLWRIHDKLYDFSEWVKEHPGGRHWLEATKGTDITEAFECNHFFPKARNLLSKFYVGPAKAKRNSLITFHENGFYNTLKRKLIEGNLLEKGSTKPQPKSIILADFLAIGVFLTGLMGIRWTPWLLPLSSVLLGMLIVCSHNFFHMRDNWRMHYFHLSLMSLSEWRISHVLSHHLYPNTSWDLEVSMFQPIWNFLPRANKRLRLASWALSPFLMASLAHVQFFRRIILNLMSMNVKSETKAEMVGFLLPLFLLIFGNQGLWRTLVTWTLIVIGGSFTFGFIGLTAAHHHPDIYHDGDFFGNDKDFGILQLAAVRNRTDVDSSFFLSMISFGNHALHHLFPTIDHSKLEAANSVFEKTCKEFKIDFKPFTSKNLIVGMYNQLARHYTNDQLKILPSAS